MFIRVHSWTTGFAFICAHLQFKPFLFLVLLVFLVVRVSPCELFEATEAVLGCMSAGGPSRFASTNGQIEEASRVPCPLDPRHGKSLPDGRLIKRRADARAIA